MTDNTVPVRQHIRGLTLIELMVAVAILGILMSVAYPSYKESVHKGRRADGQAVLLEAAQFMERYATENLRYDKNLAATAVALPTHLTRAPKDGTAQYYTISLKSVDQDSYLLRAVPSGGMKGDRCGTMTLTDTGVKDASKDDCWRR